MSPEERTCALVAATISKETICSFGTPKDWAWLAVHITVKEKENKNRSRSLVFGHSQRSNQWLSRLIAAQNLLARVGKKKRGIKLALHRLERLERRYSPILPTYYLLGVSVLRPGSKFRSTYKRKVILELARGTRRGDLHNIKSACVQRIVADSGPVHEGKTIKSKGFVVFAELEQQCAHLNKEDRHGKTTT